MTDFVKCRALSAFTEFVAGHGMLHMDPGNEECAVADVPQSVVDRLVEDGRIEVAGEHPLDHDKNGKAGGSTKQGGDDVAALRAEYKDKFGKAPFNGWKAEKLRELIDAAPAADVAP